MSPVYNELLTAPFFYTEIVIGLLLGSSIAKLLSVNNPQRHTYELGKFVGALTGAFVLLPLLAGDSLQSLAFLVGGFGAGICGFFFRITSLTAATFPRLR